MDRRPVIRSGWASATDARSVKEKAVHGDPAQRISGWGTHDSDDSARAAEPVLIPRQLRPYAVQFAKSFARREQAHRVGAPYRCMEAS